MIFFKIIRRVIAAILLIIIAVPLYAVGVTWQAANNPLTRNGDVIVVLGAAQLNGRPGEVLEARLQEAKRIQMTCPSGAVTAILEDAFS